MRTHLIDKLAEHDEPVTVFCVHDADAYGTMIHQTLQEATNARAARKIKIVNLGLDPWEAIAMGLEVETVEVTQTRMARTSANRSPTTCWNVIALIRMKHAAAPPGRSGCRPTASNSTR